MEACREFVIARGAMTPIAAQAREHTRRQLGLPTSGAIIMTGHQAAFWHAGILAKYIASDLLAAKMRVEGQETHAAHIVVDEDTNDPGLLAYPLRDAQRATLRLAPPPPAHSPVCMLPPFTAQAINSTLSAKAADIHPAAARGLALIAKSLSANADHPNAPRQIAACLMQLMAPVCNPGPAVFATQLSATDAFALLLQAIKKDPENCVSLFNAAASKFPRARVAPLKLDPDRIELPLWRLDPTSRQRLPVFSHELADIPIEQLAPRALLLTALLRAFACDLFIHGLGGGLYDQITEAWLSVWLPDWKLAPTLVVSATLHLPFQELP